MMKLLLFALLSMAFALVVLAGPIDDFCEEYHFLYTIFGLRPGAGANDVKVAFRTASKKHHPDRGGNVTVFEIYVKARDFILENKEELDPFYIVNCTPGTALVLAVMKWSLFYYISAHQKKIAYFEWNFAALSFVFKLIELPINYYVDMALAAVTVFCCLSKLKRVPN